MSVVEQFETILKEIPTLKAPGVSGSRIKKLTELAVQNVGEESKLIATLYSNCKAVPSAYKLSTLYVVDSIVRAYVDAKKPEEIIDALAPEGTYAAGAYRISELIEPLVDDALDLMVSNSQRIKVSKLVDIWERAKTFSPETLKRIRIKHFASTTPPGSPPPLPKEALPAKPLSPLVSTNSSKEQESSTILLALASLAKTNTNTNVPTQQPPSNVRSPPQDANAILSQLSAMANNRSQSPPSNSNSGGNNQDQILNMLKQMQQGGGQANLQPPQQQQQYQAPQMQNQYQQQPPANRGRDQYGDSTGGYARRNRSRSPMGRGGNNMGRRERSPPRGNNQYQQYQQGPPQGQFPPTQNFPNDQGPGPDGFNGGVQFGEANTPGTPHYRARNVGFDQTLPQGSFKVLSRTLFIGGVPRNMDEGALSSVLRPYAEVQSIILNSERKHAFVKVYSRREAEQVITQFNKDGSLPLRTRWGVGFGPRDCCNYQHGISIIPIARLTDADKNWVVHAQWGGTGGQPLVSGVVIDEPDIEIGAGISSKSMSKKMPTNSARNGPKSNKPGEPDENYVKTTLIPQHQQQQHHHQPQNFQQQPPQFGMQINNNPMGGGMYQSPQQRFAPMNSGGYQQQAGMPPFIGNQQGPPQPQQPDAANLNALANFFQKGNMNH
ncbi:uncharacterized protein KQ657_002809 [Scheffersomyces spartinae]|uniref:Uncharacterized protein n=1 Tax=Scheffersomyces spartinae TaxID=45513 RepID=A0A9P7V5N9_9ASCO|nr:uncharacterized protein KQ657_002809 [Scheffersomyces spartinae]KAG7191841.1 hypothetical protein KQ657_002809 [Scheffersomyces spartinae]